MSRRIIITADQRALLDQCVKIVNSGDISTREFGQGVATTPFRRELLNGVRALLKQKQRRRTARAAKAKQRAAVALLKFAHLSAVRDITDSRDASRQRESDRPLINPDLPPS